jgi:hypothetical protein
MKASKEFVENAEKKIDIAFEQRGIPERMKEPIREYVMTGKVLFGDFLLALFTNDLMKTFSRADGENVKLLLNYCELLYNDLPMACWGSMERIAKWEASGGLFGKDDKNV